MARQFNMYYVASQKRWLKEYRGKTYSVSCKQLGCAPGKEASWLAANSWWDKKKEEVDAQQAQEMVGNPHPRSEPIVDALMKHGHLIGTETNEEATAKFRELMQAFMESGIETLPDWLAAAVLGEERQQQIREGVQALTSPKTLPANKTVGGNVTRWLDMLKLSVRQKMINVGRFDSYSRNIKLFEKWVGAESPAEVIDSNKFAVWWTFVAIKVSENEYSTAYAKGIFMTSKQFINWLGEMRVITLPYNINSKRFKFADGPKNIETLTIEEVKTLLTSATGWSDKTKLYLLLMLNCGMYQADVADIGEDEMDWKAGTVTRSRSKTPGGPKVTYKLWPETLELMKKHRTKFDCENERGSRRVLTTDEGKPLVRLWLENEKMRRYDVIQTAFTRLFERVGWNKALKQLRKTSASELGAHPVYANYVQHFLAQSPKGVTDRHYVKPSQEVFDEAVAWLRTRYL